MKKLIFIENETQKSHEYSWENDNEQVFFGDPYSYDIPKIYTNFLESTSELINIFRPINDGEDFVIKFWQDDFLDIFKIYNPHNIQNQLLGQVFPCLHNLGYMDLVKRVYKTGETEHYTIFLYEDDNLQRLFHGKVVLSDGVIFDIVDRDSTFDLTFQGENDMFFSSKTAMAVIQNGLIVRVNQAYADMSGYPIQYILGREFTFNATQAEIAEDVNVPYKRLLNHEIYAHTDLVRVTHRLGHYIWFKVLAIPVTYRDKSAVQCICVDVTEEKNIADEANKLQENIGKIQNISKVAFGSFKRGEGFTWTSEILELFDIKDEPFLSSKELPLFKLFDPDDKKFYLKNLKQIIINHEPELNITIKCKRPSGENIYLDTYTKFLYDDEGLLSAEGFMQDVTESVLYNDKLQDALNQLTEAVKDREILVKEVHHRVKNNLQIILSLLNIDARYNKDNPEQTIHATVNRINSMALIYEQLYSTDSLRAVNMAVYLNDEIKGLFNIYNIHNINLHLDFDDIILDIDKSIPLGLIVNEIVHNTIKYAFPNGEEGNLFISFKLNDDDFIILDIIDDGVGIPDSVDIFDSSSLGMVVINNLVHQIEGELIQLNIQGTGFRIKFKN